MIVCGATLYELPLFLFLGYGIVYLECAKYIPTLIFLIIAMPLLR